MVPTDVTAEKGGSRDALPGNFPNPQFLLSSRGTFWLLGQHYRGKQTTVIVEFLFYNDFGHGRWVYKSQVAHDFEKHASFAAACEDSPLRTEENLNVMTARSSSDLDRSGWWCNVESVL
jgi:hypothetical protein